MPLDGRRDCCLVLPMSMKLNMVVLHIRSIDLSIDAEMLTGQQWYHLVNLWVIRMVFSNYPIDLKEITSHYRMIIF